MSRCLLADRVTDIRKVNETGGQTDIALMCYATNI